MLHARVRLLKNEKGLTLIELLAVIVVLGIVAAIAVPSVGNAIENSKINADKATLGLIHEAAINYVVVTNPSSLPSDQDVETLISEGFLTKTPKMQSKNETFKTFTVAKNANGAYLVTVKDGSGAEIDDTYF